MFDEVTQRMEESHVRAWWRGYACFAATQAEKVALNEPPSQGFGIR